VPSKQCQTNESPMVEIEESRIYTTDFNKSRLYESETYLLLVIFTHTVSDPWVDSHHGPF
jgi:hypothetical protein